MKPIELRVLLSLLLLGALGLVQSVGCGGGGPEPLCCVEIHPGEGERALTCEDQSAVTRCLGYDFSDCYYDSARDDEC